MRILLVQTPSVEDDSQEIVYPIGIVLLATCLKNDGFEVDVLDMNIADDRYGALKDKLHTYAPDVVGLSLRNIDPLANKTSSLIPAFTVTVKMVATIAPDAIILAGGAGFSLFPKRLLEEFPEITYGIVGEAETSLPRLLSHLEKPPVLPGLCKRKNGRVRICSPAAKTNIDDYTIPDRQLLPPGLYAEINSYVPAIGIETKRGCPLNCAYCVYPQLQGRKFRCRNPVAVVDEIEFLLKEYGVTNFHFNDPVVNMPVGHLEDICRAIVRRRLQITWSGFFREDGLTEKNIRLFERAGCNCFSFSPDGLTDGALKVLRKNLSIEDILHAAALAAKTQVCTMYHFMVNVPGENEESIGKSFALLDNLYELHAVNRNLGTVVLNNIRIFPGTPMYETALQKGIIRPDSDPLYPLYYNPQPYEALRYRLETYHQCKNTFMWQKVGDYQEPQ